MESATISPGLDFDQDGDLDTDLLSMLDLCEADDIKIYQSDKRTLYDNGETKCDPADPRQSVEGTWSYKDHKITEIGADREELTLEVRKNTGEKLSLVMTESFDTDKVELRSGLDVYRSVAYLRRQT